jgi:hypothetical protein
MIDFGFGEAAGITAILGLLVYLAACVYHRVLPPIEKPVEALGFGGLISVGFHMIYGAYFPHELCSIVNDAGKIAERYRVSSQVWRPHMGDRRWWYLYCPDRSL